MLMASMKNVWLDSSATGSFVLSPNEFKDVLRRWLEVYPGEADATDPTPFRSTSARRRRAVLVRRPHARTALAAALAEMIAAREISETQALTMARGYLHDNAAALYR